MIGKGGKKRILVSTGTAAKAKEQKLFLQNRKHLSAGSKPTSLWLFFATTKKKGAKSTAERDYSYLPTTENVGVGTFFKTLSE